MTAGPEPHSGDDTYDLIDDAVTALAERRGAWLGDDIAAMALIASLIDQAERWLPQLVHDARANGHSWDEIARALATSRPACDSTRNPPSPTADGPTTSDPASRRGHFKPSPRPRTSPKRGQIKPSWWGQMKPS